MRSTLPLVVLLLSACGSTRVSEGGLAGDSALVGDQKIESLVSLERPRVGYGENELAVYQVDLVNECSDNLSLEVKAFWYDKNGILVDDATRAWVPVHLPADGRATIRRDAPRMTAVECRIEVRLPQPLTR